MPSFAINRLICGTVAGLGFMNCMGDDMITEADKTYTVIEKIAIDKVWSPVRVGFCLLTHEDKQFVAYFNNQRRLIAGVRDLGESRFTLSELPSQSEKPPTRKTSSTVQGWDSHNYVTMAVDKEGYLHLAGNMHGTPLTYFRSEIPYDPATLKQTDMTGQRENRCTYPKFMESPEGDLLFHYRDGSSGNGVEIYNVYSVETRQWKRFLDEPLLDGLGKCNAYQNGPILGPDGWYHLLWVWRETPDAATNKDLSYARSKDLENWETASGKELPLPITLDHKETMVDPIPPGGGIINGCHKMGFDARNRLIVAYHKHDENGDTQAYAARFMDGAWKIRPISDWEGTHIFKGGGSGPAKFGTSLGLRELSRVDDTLMGLSYSHWKAGRGILVLDPESLKPVRVDSPVQRYPSELTKVVSTFPGMGHRIAADSGRSPEPGTIFVLRWESLGTNRDYPRDPPWPEDSELILYKLAVPH